MNPAAGTEQAAAAILESGAIMLGAALIFVTLFRRLKLGATLGYRFLIRNRVEITPAIGMGLVVESGSMSPATARGAGTVSLTAGVAF